MLCDRKLVGNRCPGEQLRGQGKPDHHANNDCSPCLLDLEIRKLTIECNMQMGHAVAEAAVKRGLTLIPYSFTGNREEGNIVSCEGVRVELREPEEWDATLEEVKKKYPNFIVVDYTLPAAVNGE